VLQKIKKNYFIYISTFLIIYFFFNLLDGERGLISYIQKKDILTDLKSKRIKLEIENKNLENKIDILGDNLDLDYVEILIREKFMFGKKDEKIFILEKK
tara:strand:- start:974 stop:1270 length:297 start_codon:yes stop_codon:yes gene_type:complete